MLDSDESAIFDEAVRVDPLLHGAFLEMDRLSAAIAVATSPPVKPKPGQLERLQARLGIHKVRRGPWIAAISGWAAAAALAAMWLLDHQAGLKRTRIDQSVTKPPGTVPSSSKTSSGPAHPTPHAKAPESGSAPTGVPAPAPAVAVDEGVIKTKVRAETKRLVQEIEVLRDNLETYQSRDRVLFEAVPGMALPIVMTMNPPGTPVDDPAAIARNDGHSPITTLLGDSIRIMTAGNSAANGDAGEGNQPPAAGSPLTTDHPTAIPIYDAARDAGTLVVSNLPPVEEGVVYNLWVKTLNGDKPVYVGSLPASSASGADSFDFSLGSNMVLPSGFMLTRDPADKPASPTEANTVLQGPPTPGR